MDIPSFLQLPILLAQATQSQLDTNSGTPFQWTITTIVSVLVVVGMFSVNFFTRAGMIARSTSKEAVRQPVFALMLVIGVVVILLNFWVPFFSMGDDTKMYKDCGLATVLICCTLLAIWTASMSIADEIEGKTAMTLLSKPINRRDFIVGKYLGIMQAVFWMMLPICLCLLYFTYFKVGYDNRESGSTAQAIFEWSTWSLGAVEVDIPWLNAARWAETVQIVPGLLLIFLEVAVLASISVIISTRLPMVVNLVTCFTIFVVGHLTPVLVQASAEKQGLEFVLFVARVFATVLPSLDSFNIQAAVATGKIVPPDYLGFAGLYAAAYVGAAILLAFILFEDRDLA